MNSNLYLIFIINIQAMLNKLYKYLCLNVRFLKITTFIQKNVTKQKQMSGVITIFEWHYEGHNYLYKCQKMWFEKKYAMKMDCPTRKYLKLRMLMYTGRTFLNIRIILITDMKTRKPRRLSKYQWMKRSTNYHIPKRLS